MNKISKSAKGASVSSGKKEKKSKILIIEDDVFLSNIYNKKFFNNGYEVILASDGKKGLSLAKQKKPDIILLDIMLPIMNGFEVLEEIRKDDEIKDTPVIMLTNINEQDEIKRGYNLGIKDYIIKTFITPGDIAEKVKKYL